MAVKRDKKQSPSAWRFEGMRFPFVITLNSDDKEKHKRPAFQGWTTAEYTLEEVRDYLKKGYGVGIDIKRARQLAVLDIDNKDGRLSDMYLFRLEAFFGQQGALVLATPNRGVHVFLKRPPKPLPDGRYILRWGEGEEVECEWYAGSGHRNIVLPVALTHRRHLGGGLRWRNKLPAASLGSREMIIEDFVKAFVEIANSDMPAPDLRPLDGGDSGGSGDNNQGIEGQAVGGENGVVSKPSQKLDEDGTDWVRDRRRMRGVFARLFGRGYKRLSREDILAHVRKAPAGRRHYVGLRAAVLLHALGHGWEGFVEAFVDAHSSEGAKAQEEARKEAENIIAWAEKHVEFGSWDGEDATQKNKAEKAFELLAPTGWLEHRSKTYVVLEGKWAFDKSGLRARAAGLGINLSQDAAELLIAMVRERIPMVDVHMVKHYPSFHNGHALVGIWIDKTPMVLYTKQDGLDTTEDPSSLGVVMEIGGRRREIKPELLNRPDMCAKYLVKILESYFDGDTAKVALTLALVSPLAQGVLVLVGEPNSGKTALRSFLQYMINGEMLSSDVSDVRNFITSAANSGLVAIEEVSAIKDEVYNIINQMTTSGEVAVRQLYTTDELSRLPLRASVVISTVDIKHVRGDTARRGVVLHPRFAGAKRKVTDKELYAILGSEQGVFLVGLMWLCAGFQQGAVGAMGSILGLTEHDEELASFLREVGLREGGEATVLPAWLEASNKGDIALAYWHFVKKLGLSEAQARRAWTQGREDMIIRGLGDEWGAVADRLSSDEEFRQAFESGLTAAEIAEMVEVPAEEASNWAKRLGKRYEMVVTILRELGYDIKRSYRGTGGRRTSVYVLSMQQSLDLNVANDDVPF